MNTIGRFLILVVVLTGPFIFQANGTEHQGSVRDFGSMTPEALLVRSWGNPSTLERAEIRKFLAENHPDTKYGLFARAWVALNESKKSEARRIYRSCISKYPNFLNCRYNLTYSLSDPTEKIEHFKFIVRREPAFNDYQAIRNIYFKYLGDLKNREKAEAFLASSEKKLENIFIFDFIRGMDAHYHEKNYPKAEKFYQEAIKKEGVTFEVYKKLTDLRIKRLSSAQTSKKDRAAHLNLITAYFKKWLQVPGLKAKIKAYSALVYMGDILQNVFRAERVAARFYRNAFRIYPTGEAMEKFSKTKTIKFDRATWGIRVLKLADKKLPGNHLIKMRLGNMLWNRNLKAAEMYFKQALATGPTLSYKVDAISRLGEFYEKNHLNFSKARALYLSLLDRGGDQRRLLKNLYYNRKAALDFKSAARYLTELEEYLLDLGTINKIWFANRKYELNLFLAAEKRTKKRSENDQLLDLWEERIGPSLKLNIRFPAGQSEIPAGKERGLGIVARLLSLPVAKNYVIQIEGHTDPSEREIRKDEGPTAQGQEELSLRRARAVARLLNQVYAVSLEKIKITGVKDRYPLRPSHSKEGRGVNRRVEITLAGNAAKPEISITSALNAKPFALSPNGRFMTVGYYPAQIWDVHSGVKIRDLGRGGAKRKFSPNNRFLGVVSRFTEAGGYVSNVLYIYDAITGSTVAQIAEESGISHFDWHPKKLEIVYATGNGRTVIFDLKAKRHRAVREFFNKKYTKGLVWSRDGRYIYTGQAEGKVVFVLDARTLATVKKLPGVNWVHGMGQTHDGRYLAVTDNRRNLTVYDTTTWKYRQRRISAFGGEFYPHPFKQQVILTDSGGGAHNTALLIDLETMKILARRDTEKREPKFAFSPDGSKLYQSQAEKVLVLNPFTLKNVSEITGMAVQGKSARKDSKHNNLLTQDANGIHVWSLRTGRKIHFWPGKFDSFTTFGKDSGRFLVSVKNEKKKSYQLFTLDTGNYQKKPLLKLNYEILGWEMEGNRLIVLGKPFTKPGFGSKNGSVEVYSLDGPSPRQEFRFEVPFVTEYRRYSRLGTTGFTTYDVDTKGEKIILVTYWGDGWGRGRTKSKQVRIFDLKTGEKLNTIHEDFEIKRVVFNSKDKKLLTVVLQSWAKIYDRNKGAYLKTDNKIQSTLNVIDLPQSKGKIYWALNKLEKITPAGKTSVPVTKENIAKVLVFEDRNLLVVLTKKNEIEYYDLKTLKKRLTILSKNGNQWIAFTPEGVFSSSARGTQKVFWSVGSLRLDFKSLKARYEKPKWIAKLIKNLFSRQKGLKNGSKPMLSNPSLKPEPDLFILPYSLTMANPAVMETDKDTFSLKLRVVKLRPNIPDPKIVFTQQGQRISGRGVAVVKRPVTQKFSGGKYSIERKFKLNLGMNVIQASLMYRNARLLTQTVIVNRKAGKASNMRGVHLWYLGIGVSDYSNPDFNLKYADADVIALEKTFKKQEGILFKKVRTKLLLNGDVTDKNIKLALHRFLKKASDQDIVIIFLAGHGIQDNDQTLYFMTHDSDLNEPYTGVDLDFFHKFLRKRPLNQKAVMLLDICQSGAFGRANSVVQRGRITAEDAVKQLADGTGLLVLASSTGKEFSLEDERFGGGHGAFSSAVIEAFDQGRADKISGDRNGVVSVLEMFNYVSRRVPEITDNKQHPTMPIVRNLRDFPLARY